MRVLFLVPELFGTSSGIARHARTVCRALNEAGHRVRVVSLHDPAAARLKAKTALPAVTYIPCFGKRGLFIQRALRSLAFRPDIVLVSHAHLTPVGWGVARLAGAHLVTFIHGIEVWERLSGLRRRALQASQILSVSRFSAQRAAQVNALRPTNIRVLHNCLDPQFQAKTSEAIVPPDALSSDASPSDALSLLTVARISLTEQYKGHDVVIRALPALLSAFPALIYHVVGDGDARPHLEVLAQQQGVAHAVRFHGLVSEAELVACYNEASLFIMPSRFEGFGLVFLEAMTYGKPVIAGNQDASPEVVADGKVGFTVDPISIEAVTRATSLLLRDGELRAAMGEAAKLHVQENFAFPRFKEQLLELLDETLVQE